MDVSRLGLCCECVTAAGLIVLIVNARTPYKLPSDIGILTGEYTSFNARWIAIVGTTICITMLVNIIAPHLPLLFSRLWDCCKRRKKAFAKLVTQQQADQVSVIIVSARETLPLWRGRRTRSMIFSCCHCHGCAQLRQLLSYCVHTPVAILPPCLHSSL